MRNRLTMAAVALLLLVPANAFADEGQDQGAVGDDICYANPEDESCVESEVEERPEPTEPEVETEEASVEIVTTSAESDDAALAETGVSATLFSVIAGLLLAAGALLLVVTRRRGSAA